MVAQAIETNWRFKKDKNITVVNAQNKMISIIMNACLINFRLCEQDRETSGWG